MDQSYSDSDVTLSPSQILERLQVLRQLQLLQRGKLQKQRLEYHDSPEITSSITEIVSHFSNSTSYNTFRSLLQSTEASNEVYAESELAGGNLSNLSKKDNIHINMDGVAALNLSNASEPPDTPISARSSARKHSENEKSCTSDINTFNKKQISLDEMPILSPKKDFETLVIEKLNNEIGETKVIPKPKTSVLQKKAFLKRGEGMARFGLQKKNLVIQNTKSLPWRKNTNLSNNVKKGKPIENKTKPVVDNKNNNVQVEILVDKPKNISPLSKTNLPTLKKTNSGKSNVELQKSDIKEAKQLVRSENPATCVTNSKSSPKLNYNTSDNGFAKGKQSSVYNKEKTWATVLTKEQDDLLRQLKQSSYYKNFVSPVKSIASDISRDDNSKLQQERETAEQNMFELLENKVSNESFNINNSFLSRFLRQNSLECSGESTPIIMQKCLSKNPNLMHLLPEIKVDKSEMTCTDVESCYSECSDCNDNCSSVSECCSCKTSSNISYQTNKNKEGCIRKNEDLIIDKEKESHKDVNKTADNEVLNNNMVEMNAKLVATSELLKDRLRELEDEIETFRKENANLNKMREDIELERQKFYEEKSLIEQKFNEEKILSEYYLAEEKEKLSKQKQMYERYVKDMRGRLNKKEKDEVINLKKEIVDLKEEIRSKDAKSTSTIARLRNQLKIMEKEKKNFEDEIEKLKKENRRIQHSNDISRRLTNIKYLEEINKKLNNMTSRDAHSDIVYDPDMKYKAYEIERQSRTRKNLPANKGTIRPRAKSVPNLKVTSRYAKYFSQKDSLSEKEKNRTFHNEHVQIYSNSSNNDISNSDEENNYDDYENKTSDSEISNNLEKIYNTRFKSVSPLSKSHENFDQPDNNDFFLRKGTSARSLSKHSISPNRTNYDSSKSAPNVNLRNTLSSRNSNSSKSPSSIYQENYEQQECRRSKSPVSILSNKSSSSQKCGTVINKETYLNLNMIPSPEPTVSKSSLTKTNLNPTEVRKPDGTKEIRFPNGNIKIISADGKYSKFVYYNGDVKENFYNEGRIKYYYAETKTFHTTHPDGLEVLEFPDGQVEKRYRDGSTEIRLPNGSIRYFDPKNEHVREEWRFPDGAALTVSANGEKRIVFANGQIEVHAKEHKRREFPDGTVKLVYNDGTSETRYSSGRVRIKDKHGNLLMDSATRQ
ncbi:centromere protein J [Danaus plexippus]|uniref:centromere protein J n=1 Tax=Danaus plexippus TaxID=13037 RepID=UPI002AB287EA|nr:centromere protein J [Danaus plexippus]